MKDNEFILDDAPIIIEDSNNTEEIMWELLVDNIMKGDVIPVIGEKIVMQDRTVNKILIDHLSKKEGVTTNPQTYSQLLYDDNYKTDRDHIYGMLTALIEANQYKFKPSSLLQRVLSIHQFPFVITTTIDYTVENTMRQIWKDRERDLKVLYFNNNPADKQKIGDVSKDSDLEIPTIYYMFGKANNPCLHSFVVTDEDMLSFCQSWLTEGKRPKNLAHVLGDKFLLFLGCSYPDWLIRFIWYSMRKELDKSGMLVDAEAEDTLIAFLNRLHINTQRNPEVVIFEIEKRLAQRMKKYNELKFDTPRDKTDVFISYSRTDSEKAEELYNALINKGLNVWYDKKNLAAGDKWLEKINDAITTTKYCIILLSNSMKAQIHESHVYRKEWNMAIEHASGMTPNRGFIVPILLDDININDATLGIPKIIRDANAKSIAEYSVDDIAQYMLNRVNDLANVNDLAK